jgi:hypothetical protein
MAIVNCGYNPPSKSEAKAAVERDCGFNPGLSAATTAEPASQGEEAPTAAAPNRKRSPGVTVRGTT